jgi:hypothetical protein
MSSNSDYFVLPNGDSAYTNSTLALFKDTLDNLVPTQQTFNDNSANYLDLFQKTINGLTNLTNSLNDVLTDLNNLSSVSHPETFDSNDTGSYGSGSLGVKLTLLEQQNISKDLDNAGNSFVQTTSALSDLATNLTQIQIELNILHDNISNVKDSLIIASVTSWQIFKYKE